MTASLLPWADWQFYAATAVALAGLWLMLRPLLSRKKAKGCAGCALAQKAPPLPSAERLVGLGGQAAGLAKRNLRSDSR